MSSATDGDDVEPMRQDEAENKMNGITSVGGEVKEQDEAPPENEVESDALVTTPIIRVLGSLLDREGELRASKDDGKASRLESAESTDLEPIQHGKVDIDESTPNVPSIVEDDGQFNMLDSMRKQLVKNHRDDDNDDDDDDSSQADSVGSALKPSVSSSVNVLYNTMLIKLKKPSNSPAREDDNNRSVGSEGSDEQRVESSSEVDSTKSSNDPESEAESDSVRREAKGTSSSGVSIPFLRGSTLLRKDKPELPHKFKTHTYRSPTKCGICEGLLVGLWSQGLKCEECGLDVHRGEGIGEHDNCRAEALLQPCQGSSGEPKKEEQPVKLREAIKEVREMAKSSPDFLKQVRAQMDKDLKSHAKNYVVASSVEEERSKNFRRLREWLVPVLERIDQVEMRGEGYALAILLYYHVIAAGVVASVAMIGFIIALWPKHGFNVPALRLALIHDSTVLGALHVTFLLLAILVRQATFTFKRKTIIFDQFLRDVFGINAEGDIGISVGGAASRSRYWSDRVVLSSAISCCAAVLFWHAVQPSLMPP